MKSAICNQKSKIKKGFTLIEILIVIAIFAMLSTSVIVFFRYFEKELDLSTTANQIINTLRLAANNTIASKGSSVHGVYFENDFYVLFSSSTYSPSDPNNVTRSLPSGIEIVNINIGGGSDVVFGRLTGTTTNAGTIDVRLTSDTTTYRTISILSSGQAGLGGTVSPVGNRITDSRHLHFSLLWSIQNASTMTLAFSDFPNPDVQENIVMIGYFNPGQTEFDWQGTINVYGENQTVRIRTHYLDAGNTTLSIRRDGRVNSKALDISIDGKDIVSYAADGTATVGVFGGTMEQQ